MKGGVPEQFFYDTQYGNHKNKRKVITMRLSKKMLAVIFSLIMATSALGAFGVSAADERGQTASSSQTAAAETQNENIKVGKVTAVNGSQLTIAMGEFSKKQSSTEKASDDENSDGTVKQQRSKRQKPDNNTQSDADSQTDTQSKPVKKAKTETDTGSESSTDSDSQTKAEKAGGRHVKKHGGKGGRHDKFTENGTTETVNITSDITVTKKGETISAADIKEGDIIKLKYDNNNKLISVKVSSKHKHSKTADEKATTESSADSSNKSADQSSNA